MQLSQVGWGDNPGQTGGPFLRGQASEVGTGANTHHPQLLVVILIWMMKAHDSPNWRPYKSSRNRHNVSDSLAHVFRSSCLPEGRSYKANLVFSLSPTRFSPSPSQVQIFDTRDCLLG